MTPRLVTPRLVLEPLRADDARELATVLADPALYAFIGGSPPALELLHGRFQRMLAGSGDPDVEWHNWTIRLAGGGAAIGTLQATVEGGPSRAEIAWVVGVPWQGRGYATEAASALVAWLESGGVATIEAHVHPEHPASASVARRAGLASTSEVVDGETVWRRHAGA